MPTNRTVNSFQTQTKTAQTLSNSSNAVDDIPVVDNPCWGSPTSCSLADLLVLVNKRQSILFENDDFIVLNKPPDLRMDGNYPATVHKLLTYWYPPPSLIRQAKDDHDDNDDDWLLQRVSSLHRHSDTADNELRPCHQLDYATSGVLLVARTKAAAARARVGFENRLVHKTYTAVLLGHLNIPNKTTPTTTESDAVDPWPVLRLATLQTTLEQMEESYRKLRHRSHKDTWNGYLPVHALFQQWQQKQRTQQVKTTTTAQQQQPTKKVKKTTTTTSDSKLSDAEWNLVWAELDDWSDTVREEARHSKWKNLRKSNLATVIVPKFERAGQVYNDLMREKKKAQLASDRKNTPFDVLLSLPPFFCVAGDSPLTTTSSSSKHRETFYISAPLAQVDDDFAMRIHPAHGHFCPHLQVGDADHLNYKPSLTRCTVLERTYLVAQHHDDKVKGNDHYQYTLSDHETISTEAASDTARQGASGNLIPVTVVQMEPRTGRRHQLRVHAALTGHPVVGDPTYSSDSVNSQRNGVSRLCLHSVCLEIPALLLQESSEVCCLKVDSRSPFQWLPNGEQGTVDIRML